MMRELSSRCEEFPDVSCMGDGKGRIPYKSERLRTAEDLAAAAIVRGEK